MLRSFLIDNQVVTEKIGAEKLPQVDVIVAGLGCAGIYAAMAAADSGLRVLAFDRLTYTGGTGTGGGIFGYYYGHTGGLFELTDVEAKDESLRGWSAAPDLRRVTAERKLVELGVDLRYEAGITAVLKEGNRVCGVEWIEPAGIQRVACRYLIDCTGDGVALALAGCSFIVGREIDGEPQPYSSVPVFTQDGRGVHSANFDAGYVNPCDPDDFSAAIIHGGSLHLRPRVEEAGRLLWTSDLLGIRETRLLVGEETIRLEDFLSRKPVNKPVFHALSNHDSHSKDWAFEGELIQDWIVTASLWGLNYSIPVPMGALIPKGVDGVLVAGRCLAVDHDMAQSVRMQRDMYKSGEVVGRMAALAIAGKVDVRDIDYDTLLAQLQRTGCTSDWQAHPIPWLSDSEVIRLEMDSPRAGLAIWSCRVLGEAIRPKLLDWLREPKDHLRRNSALALGLMRSPEALPLLREMAKEPDSFLPLTSRGCNQTRGLAAICLLGNYADAESVSLLLNHLSPQAEIQLMTHTVRALLRIGEKHVKCRKTIASGLRQLLENPKLEGTLVLKISSPTGVNVTEPLHNLLRLFTAESLKRWGIANELLGLLRTQPLTFREKRLLAKLTA